MNNNEIISIINQIPSEAQRDLVLHRIADLSCVMREMMERAMYSENVVKHRLIAASQAIRSKIDDIMEDTIKRYNLSTNNDL